MRSPALPPASLTLLARPSLPARPPPTPPPRSHPACSNDARAVMLYMQGVQEGGLDPDDPLASYMLQAGARICKTLGQDFIPYLQVSG